MKKTGKQKKTVKHKKNIVENIKDEWVQKFSKKQNIYYWFNRLTGETSWMRPAGAPAPAYITTPEHIENVNAATTSNFTPTAIRRPSPKQKSPVKTTIQKIDSFQSKTQKHKKEKKTSSPKIKSIAPSTKMFTKLMEEHKSIMPADFPKLIDSVDLEGLLHKIKTEDVITEKKGEAEEMRAVFTLRDDSPADFTRAIQEEEILKTKLKGFDKRTKKTYDLPSFWDVWRRPHSKLPGFIKNHKDPNEAKWLYAIPNRDNLGYKVATTFMPGYARALYEYFGATRVLDPCAGWGDRLTGAMCAKGVEKYVAFDPNRNLRLGYATIMRYGGNELTKVTPTEMEFSNGFEIHSKPFEKGILPFADESFDFAFTSPPFFDYEMYNPANPAYRNWYDEFYTPLFQQTYRCLKPGSYFGIHIGDTSAGEIMDFLMNRVQEISGFKYQHSIGLKGMMSNKIRTVWMFYKPRPGEEHSPAVKK